MRYLFLATSRFVMAALVFVLAVPAISAGQTRNREGGDDRGGGGSQAVPRGSAPAPTPTPAPAPAAAAPAPESSPAPRRTPAAQAATGSESTPRNTGARPREGRPAVGTAVPRGSVPRPPRVDTAPVVVPVYYGSYWPWGFGGLGYGSYYGSYYPGFYDPWYGAYGSPYGSYGYPYGSYGYPYGSYGYSRSSYTYPGDGELRLKIKPREAQVFVDGYYVGIVDDFDGVFQRLRLEPGPHRIEVRASGYETLTFDVQIRFDDTTKFEGELQRIR